MLVITTKQNRESLRDWQINVYDEYEAIQRDFAVLNNRIVDVKDIYCHEAIPQR